MSRPKGSKNKPKIGVVTARVPTKRKVSVVAPTVAPSVVESVSPPVEEEREGDYRPKALPPIGSNRYRLIRKAGVRKIDSAAVKLAWERKNALLGEGEVWWSCPACSVTEGIFFIASEKQPESCPRGHSAYADDTFAAPIKKEKSEEDD